MQNNDKGFFLKIIPRYAIIPIVVYIFVYSVTYFGAGFLINFLKLRKGNIIAEVDDYIPYVSFFVIPYCCFYLYIVFGPILISRVSKENFFKYIFAGITGSLIGFVTFLVKPTYVNVCDITEHNIFDKIVILLRNMDVKGNAWPSFHCFLSWLIFIVVNNLSSYDKSKRIKIFGISIFICISTLFIKQHGILDVVGGILLAEISWKIVNKKFVINFIRRFFLLEKDIT